MLTKLLAEQPQHPEALALSGTAALVAGRMEEAMTRLQQALALRPDLAMARDNLGIVLARLGRVDEAIAVYREGLRRVPHNAVTHFNLGTAYSKNKAWSDALACYREAVRLQPNYPAAWKQLGLTAAKLSLWPEAETTLRTALRFEPQSAPMQFQLGNALQNQQRPAEAIAHFREAIRIQPNYAEPRINLGSALSRMDQLPEAVQLLREATQLLPTSAEAFCNLGDALSRHDDPAGAEAALRESVRLKPELAEAWLNLGTVLEARRKYEEAVDAFRRSITLRPTFVEALTGLGNSLTKLDRMDEAIASHEQALAVNPRHVGTFINLGETRKRRQEFARAAECFEQALAIDPQCPEAHHQRADLWLLLGDWQRGWDEYEWRWKNKLFRRPNYAQPPWDGGPLNGRTLFVGAEQGLGDMLQFARYAEPLRSRGGRIIWQCRKPLRTLLAGCPGIYQLVNEGEPPPPFDVWTSLMSLPRLFGTTVEHVPGRVPYLFADDRLVARWRAELERLDEPGSPRRRNVGIVWQGNPQYLHDHQRSVPLRHFGQLAAVPGVRLIGLQKNHGREQLAECAGQFPVVDLAERLDVESAPFCDTAAVLANLDLVVTSDTALAHLAGAMGVRVWLATSAVPDWRWLLDRDDSPWYPTMRLFRQRRPGDWADVFARMASELDKMRIRD